MVAGDVDVISAFSSDGRIAQYDLKVLTDPKGALPPYDAILLVSAGACRRHADAGRAEAADRRDRSGDHAARQSDGRPPPDDKQSPQQAARWLEGRLRR
ncbi:MAG: glycine betaine ABC transporter substrate-binding protein [Rhizomicrobium sp.]